MRVPAVTAARGSAEVGWARGSNRNRMLICLSFSESSLGLRSLEYIGLAVPESGQSINGVMHSPPRTRRSEAGISYMVAKIGWIV